MTYLTAYDIWYEPIDHRPSSLATIKPIDHRAYRPSSILASDLLSRLLSLSACFLEIKVGIKICHQCNMMKPSPDSNIHLFMLVTIEEILMEHRHTFTGWTINWYYIQFQLINKICLCHSFYFHFLNNCDKISLKFLNPSSDCKVILQEYLVVSNFTSF